MAGRREKKEYILNRIIRLTKDGWELEADQRHVDVMVDHLNSMEPKELQHLVKRIRSGSRRRTEDFRTTARLEVFVD